MVNAVRDGKFHIYAVGNIDEGIEVLTGVEAGQRGKKGTYPRDSINYRVERQLKTMAAKLRQFAGPSAQEKKNKNRAGQ